MEIFRNNFKYLSVLGGKISDDWQDKLSEFVSKLEDKSLAQKLKMLMAGQKPSELLALGYEVRL